MKNENENLKKLWKKELFLSSSFLFSLLSADFTLSPLKKTFIPF